MFVMILSIQKLANKCDLVWILEFFIHLIFSLPAFKTSLTWANQCAEASFEIHLSFPGSLQAADRLFKLSLGIKIHFPLLLARFFSPNHSQLDRMRWVKFERLLVQLCELVAPLVYILPTSMREANFPVIC